MAGADPHNTSTQWFQWSLGTRVQNGPSKRRFRKCCWICGFRRSQGSECSVCSMCSSSVAPCAPVPLVPFSSFALKVPLFRLLRLLRLLHCSVCSHTLDAPEGSADCLAIRNCLANPNFKALLKKSNSSSELGLGTHVDR